MQFTGVARGPVRIRPMADTPADVQAMLKWLTDERLLQHWDGRDNPYTEEGIREKFVARIGGEIVPCIVEVEGAPVGYLQFYPLPPAEQRDYGYPAGELIFGLDQFIGEPACWNQGLGTAMVSLILDYLLREHRPDRVILDPVVENVRAIRCYERCGFRKVKIVPAHEFHEGRWRDAWLMEVLAAT